MLDPADAAGRRSARFWTTLLMVADLEVVSSQDPVREPGEWALIDAGDEHVLDSRRKRPDATSACRSRLVAATKRTSMGRPFSPPTRVT